MLNNLFVPAPAKLIDMPVRDARHILAARSWCVLRTAGFDPLPRLESYLLSSTAAARFDLLMETVTQIWPEPLGIHKPCCGLASIDELLLSNSIRLAKRNARPQFEVLLKEMLSEDARHFFFSRAQALYD